MMETHEKHLVALALLKDKKIRYLSLFIILYCIDNRNQILKCLYIKRKE